MIKNRFIVSITLVSSFVFIFSGCSRSTAFKKDKDYYEDYPQSYYHQSAPAKEDLVANVKMLGQPKKRSIVFDFLNNTPIRGPLGEVAAEEFRRELHLTGRVNLSEEVHSKMKTKDFIQGDRIKVAQLVREGVNQGVYLAFIGRVAKVAFRQKGSSIGLFKQLESIAATEIEVKVFDIHSGKEVAAIVGQGEASSHSMVVVEEEQMQSDAFRFELASMAVREAVYSIMNQTVASIEKTQWRGKIAKMINGKAYLNAGQKSGVAHGDILKVLTPGEPVYDPETGALMGYSKGRHKGTLEVTGFIGEDAAEAILHSGGSFQKGDVVTLY